MLVVLAGCSSGDDDASGDPTSGDATGTEAETTAGTDDATEPADEGTGETETAAAGDGEPVELSVVWFEWAPAQLLEDFANQEYSKVNPNVTISMDAVPNPQWHDAIFTQFAARQTDFDIAILDSQWIGEAVEGGHVLDLTEFAAESINPDDYPQNLLSAYGQYPRAEDGLYDPAGNLYGLPALADSYVLVYRKDLIGEPPATWDEMIDKAAACQEENEGMYGLAFHGSGGSDEAAVMLNTQLWTHGGEIWDPQELQVEGILNSPENIEAATQLTDEMLPLTPPGFVGTAFISEVNAAMAQGQTCMGFNWVAGLEGLQTPEVSGALGETEEEILEKLGFARVPTDETEIVSLGGMGMSVSAYTENEQEVLDFLAWFQQPEVQVAWGAFGGVPAQTAALESDEFLSARPWNPAFVESVEDLKDFWNMPEYFRLLDIHNSEANAMLSGTQSAEDTLNNIASQQQEVMDEIREGGL
ncbi:extracellular solute-binding protein [Salsipaludibacter albus]|uniref:extracellular solute-binding protein n=1 Tax=Salsipaludibacter albus TaxID=2849650 RepID=UPI001EE422BF|nr:extracellular solute-binding protein [Salsipaludibacter albus]